MKLNHSVKWIIEKIGKLKYNVFFLTFLQSLVNLSGIINAVLFKLLVDSAISGNFQRIKNITICLFLVLLLQNLLHALLRRIQEITSVEVEGLLKKHVLSNILNRDYLSVSKIHSGEWMNKITNDVSVVSRNVVHLLPNMVSILIQIIVSIGVLTYLKPDFIMICVLFVFVVLVFESVFYRKIKDLHKDVQEKDGLLRSFIQECISSLIVIKAYNKADSSLNELDRYFIDYEEADLRKNLFSVVMNLFFGTGLNGTLIIGAIYCAYGIISHSTSYGTFVAIVQILTQLRSPLTNAFVNIPNYYSMIGSIERLKESDKYLLDSSKEKQNIQEFYDTSFQAICLKDLSFTYQDRDEKQQVIKDLSFDIKKGEFIGISGPSGCGKSTLFKLLLNLYQPLSGSILIQSDEKIFTYDSSWRDLYAYVPQDNQLMKGSIRDVVGFGSKYDENRMNDALDISCALDFVNTLPDGIDTQLNEKGGWISEGQMQRIAIARAIYSQRPILLLDEVTSSLNEELELRILNNIRQMTDKTVLLITHHKKALDYVDTIIRVVEKEDSYIWENTKD